MQSVAAASEAEATRARLYGVAERTRSLAAHYAQREGDIVGADLRMEHHLQQHVTELLDERGCFTRSQGIQRLVALFEERVAQRLVALLELPRATQGRVAQAAHGLVAMRMHGPLLVE